MFTYIDFSVYQILISLVIVISSIFILNIIGARNKKDLIFITIMYIWHTLFALLYYNSTAHSGNADANMYYRTAVMGYNIQLESGTAFIRYLTYCILSIVDLSYLNVTLIYNLFGSLGLVILYLSLKKYLKEIAQYWSLALFLPSMSYWSSGIGKDSMVFFAISIFIYAVTTSTKKTLLVSLSLAIIFLIRPHIALAILLSFIVYFILQSKSHIILKVISLPFITVASVIALSFVQEYVGIDEASVEGVEDYFDSRKNLNMGGGSSIDTSSMILPVKMFSYLFRPFPFEANSLIVLIASIENSILFLSFAYIIYKAKSSFNLLIKNENLWLFLYVITTWIMLSYGLKNLGIAARQKWMFMPVIIYLLLNIYSNYKRERLYKNS